MRPVEPDQPEQFALGVSNCRSVSQVVEGVQDAEGRGAEMAFVAEDVNCRDSFELCALCAAATDRIRIGTGVVNPYTRNPTSLAMAIATLDEISGGRAVLGLGTSSPSLIEHQMGITVGKPVTVMRESTELVRALLGGGAVTYAGVRFAYRDAQLEVLPVQSHVPIFFAAMGPLMLRLVGQLADGVLLNVGASVEYVEWAVGEIRAGALAANRSMADITVAAWLSAYVTDDYETGLHRAREWLAAMLSIPRQGELLLERSGIDSTILTPIRSHFSAYPPRGDKEAAGQEVPPGVAERLALIGTAEQVRARIRDYRAAGVDLPVLGMATLSALY